jgi:hypothetical protein
MMKGWTRAHNLLVSLVSVLVPAPGVRESMREFILEWERVRLVPDHLCQQEWHVAGRFVHFIRIAEADSGLISSVRYDFHGLECLAEDRSDSPDVVAEGIGAKGSAW